MTRLLPFLLAACAGSADPDPARSQPAAPTPPSTTVQPPSASELDARVQAAHDRLAATAGGQALRRSIDAHGGLRPWLQTGAVRFDFDYQPAGKPERRMYTRNEVDLWSVRAVQTELGDGADATLGWDGAEAWISPSPEAFPSPAAFWATTPYYFVGIPWVLADPGSIHTDLGKVALTDDNGTTLDTHAVKVSFDPGTGQASDDYYVLHIDPESHRAVALRYIVTDPAVRKADAPPPRETILFLRQGEPDSDSGLFLARHYDGYHYADDTVGERKSTVDITGVQFGPTIEVRRFSAP